MNIIEVSVSKNALDPAVIVAGARGSFGQVRLRFTFSSDWDGLTKYIIFYSMRGAKVVVPYLAGEIDIPSEIMAYGGSTRFTVQGVSLDADYMVTEKLAVTGSIWVTYTPGENPRLEGKLTPSTLELFLDQAKQYVDNVLWTAKASGEFRGDPGEPGAAAGFGDPTISVTTLPAGQNATASISADGPDTAKTFSFAFGIPKGEDGVATNVPDGLIKEGRLVYFTVDGVPTGTGVDIDGTDFRILGHYSTLADLQEAVPDPETGDAYGVGTSTPYNVYVFDGPMQAWANYGPIGSGGGAVDAAMSSSSINAVQNRVIKAYVDAVSDSIPGSLKNPYALTAFGTSYDGSSAVTLTADSVIDGTTASSTKPVSTMAVKTYVDAAIGDVDAALAEIGEVIGDVSANNTSQEESV